MCGKTESEISAIGRIMGGRKANLGEIPWQLLLKEPRRGGASLISDRWAVTAAHVVDGIEQSTLTFFGGVIDGLKAKTTDSDVVVMVAEKIIIHPSYVKGVPDLKHTSYDNDIALIRLSSRVKLGPTVIPICLPEADGGLKVDQLGTVSGWGGTDKFEKTKILHHVNVAGYTHTKCEDTPVTSEKQHMVFTQNMFCAGAEGKDSCAGDSGGPFILPRLGFGNQNNRGPYRLKGIVSWGSPCGERQFKGYYTKVENYLDWIKETMEKPEQNDE